VYALRYPAENNNQGETSLSMEIPNQFKLIAAGVMLFGAVAVDFASSLMSVVFDLFFISLAIWVVLPVIKKGINNE